MPYRSNKEKWLSQVLNYLLFEANFIFSIDTWRPHLEVLKSIRYIQDSMNIYRTWVLSWLI